MKTFEAAVAGSPDHPAVRYLDTVLTYRQLDALSDVLGAGLAANGVGPGDRVALSCPNLPDFPIIYYGILKAGAVVVPLNVLLKGREIAYHLQDAQARAYFCFEGTPELPMGAEGFAGTQESPALEHFFIVTADPQASSPIAGAQTLGDHPKPANDEHLKTGQR